MSRIDAREKAMQILYQLDIDTVDPEEQYADFLEKYTYEDNFKAEAEAKLNEAAKKQFEEDIDAGLIVALSKDDLKYLKNLVFGVLKHIDELDKIYGQYLKNWTIERLPVLERTLLRIATYEIVYDDNVPDSVAINEAINLSHRYVDEDSYSYINAVLGKVSANKAKD